MKIAKNESYGVLAVMYYVRYLLSFRQIEDILHERRVDITHETVRFWVERFGLEFAGEIRRNERVFNRIGVNIWTKFSSKLMTSCITFFLNLSLRILNFTQHCIALKLGVGGA